MSWHGLSAFCSAHSASFGLSMLSAPAYILHMKLHDIFSWYSHGTSEYIWQGMLLIIMCIIIRKFKMRYIFSFFNRRSFRLGSRRMEMGIGRRRSIFRALAKDNSFYIGNPYNRICSCPLLQNVYAVANGRACCNGNIRYI